MLPVIACPVAVQGIESAPYVRVLDVAWIALPAKEPVSSRRPVIFVMGLDVQPMAQNASAVGG